MLLLANLNAWLAVPAVLAALLLIGLAVYYFRCQFTIPQFLLFVADQLVTRILWQGAVIVCNHRSSVDPFFSYLTTRRVVHWMVAKEYCERGVAAFLMRICQVIPVNRSGIDTASTKQAIRLASAGGLVGMFPEGRINKTDELLLPGRPGAALIALKARVPIIPCYVRGAPVADTLPGHFFRMARVELTVGPPIDTSPYYDRADEREVQEMLTLQLLAEIARLAGAIDFQPKLAGRRWKPGTEEPTSA